MIGENDLQTLTEFSGSRQVLSVYADTNLAQNSKDAIKLMVREAIKSLQAPSAAEDAEAVAKYLDYEYDWQSRGVAIFSSGQELWKAVPLPIAVKTQAFLANRPYVRTLVDLLDQFGQYTIALIDRESVRLFSVAWGKIQPETEAFGEELKRHKQGGWAAARYQRREDNLALHNLKQAVEVIQAYCARTNCNRLMLAGSGPVLAQVADLLPNDLRRMVIGEFVADMVAPPNELLRLSLDVATQVELEQERELVTLAITAAAKGGAGTIGLDDTLAALHSGRVRQLLVEENYQAAGYVCSKCGYVSVTKHNKCPLCGSTEIVKTADVVNLAIHKAIEMGTNVNIIRQNPDLITAGGMAALTRY
jgi:peptide chain release factor subunit 1